MGSRRTLITIAAFVVGAIAVVLIYGYVGNVRDSAFGEAERVRVFVVKEMVAKGTYGEETQQRRLIVEDEIPRKFYPPNAISSFEDIGGKQAIAPLAVNQIVTVDMFAEPAEVHSTFSDRLAKINDEDQVAFTLNIDEARAVAGLLQPGDYVNVMMAQGCPGGASSSGEGEVASAGSCPGSAGSATFPARYLYQKARILAIGQTPVPAVGEAPTQGVGGNSSMITLIVPTKAALYLGSVASSDQAGNIYLTLVSRDYQPVPQEPVGADELLPAEDADEITPYGPSGAEGT